MTSASSSGSPRSSAGPGASRDGRPDDLDEETVDTLVPLVYDELRHLAHRHRQGEPQDSLLNTTALVHEAYIRLAKSEVGRLSSETQFMALASTVMRRILVDDARRRKSEKRGGGRVRVALAHPRTQRKLRTEAPDPIEVMALDEALIWLAQRDARMARVVECRLFGGMTIQEIADHLGVGRRTVERLWTRARAYLAVVLEDEEREVGSGGA